MTANKELNNNGWYEVVCSACTYRLPTRYQEVSTIGQGGFGSVIKAKDIQTGRDVAIKKIIQPFPTETHAKRTYRELALLKYLNHPDAGIIKLYDVFTPEETVQQFKSVYFVFNFVDYTLNEYINRGKPSQEAHIIQIIYSILRGLKYIHSANIIHRDLKPLNIGLDKNSNVFIFDFGLSRKIPADDELTAYVVTRYWRAPEIIMNLGHYDNKIDIWSVGCIMAELIIHQPLFKGTDYMSQVKEIMRILGTPNTELLQQMCTPGTINYLLQQESYEPQDLDALFGYRYNADGRIVSGISPLGVKFLKSLLTFDPRVRPTAQEALSHEYLEGYHSDEDEPTMAHFNDIHQDANYSVPEWKNVIWQAIHEFTPPAGIYDDVDDNDE